MPAPLITLAALGAFHGLNPGMGWLFAVALGMQEGRRNAVWRALIPLTVGHCLAIAAAVLVATVAGIVLSPHLLCRPVAVILIGLSIWQCYRHFHLRWASMRVGLGGLTWWSFLMASAHGAGLMVLPLFLSMTTSVEAPACHRYAASPQATLGAAATFAHGMGYLAATALAAWLVVDRFGLGLLRKAWINLDLIWAPLSSSRDVSRSSCDREPPVRWWRTIHLIKILVFWPTDYSKPVVNKNDRVEFSSDRQFSPHPIDFSS